MSTIFSRVFHKIPESGECNSTINSMCIGLLISCNYIAAVIGHNGSIIGILCVVLFLQILTTKGFVLPLNVVLLSLIVSAFFCVSILVANDPSYANDYFLKFIRFGVIALLLSPRKFREDTIYGALLVIGFITIPIIHHMDINSLSSGNKMGLTYSLLPIVFAAVIKLSRRLLYKVMSLAVLLSSSLVLQKIASRGVVFSICVFLILYFVVKICKTKITRYTWITILCGIILIVAANIWTILFWCQAMLHSVNISVYPLDKSLLYYQQNKYLNDRGYLWTVAIQGVLRSPIWGHGIGSFEELYGLYTHNVFLECLWEGGILFFVPVAFTFVKTLLGIINNDSEARAIFLLFLFSLSFISLMFSSVLWMNQSLWMLVGLELVGYSVFTKQRSSLRVVDKIYSYETFSYTD